MIEMIDYCVDLEAQNIGQGWKSESEIRDVYSSMDAFDLIDRFTNYEGGNPFIVVDTWNGEGYSSENGTQMRLFLNKLSAYRYAYEKALEMECGTPQKHTEGFKGFGYENALDYGAFQVAELPVGTYAIMINTSENKFEFLTEAQYNSVRFDIHILFVNNYATRGFVNVDSMFDEYADEENGDCFYRTTEFGLDADYQFRLIKNLF
jgi:hypothetical protein